MTDEINWERVRELEAELRGRGVYPMRCLTAEDVRSSVGEEDFDDDHTSDEVAKRVMAFADLIPDEDLWDDGSGENGREDMPHCTVKYGLHTEARRM